MAGLVSRQALLVRLPTTAVAGVVALLADRPSAAVEQVAVVQVAIVQLRQSLEPLILVVAEGARVLRVIPAQAVLAS